MNLGLPKQVVTVFADPIQPGEYRFVVNTFALDVEEGAFGEVVTEQRARAVFAPPRVTGVHGLHDQRYRQASPHRPSAASTLQLRSLTHLFGLPAVKMSKNMTPAAPGQR